MTLNMSAIMQKWQVNPKRKHFKTTIQFLKRLKNHFNNTGSANKSLDPTTVPCH